MRIATMLRRRLLAAAVLPAAAFAAMPDQVVAPDAEAGGGALAAGPYAAFTTIAANGAAVRLSGGIYEVTPGLERRRSLHVDDRIFASGFE